MLEESPRDKVLSPDGFTSMIPPESSKWDIANIRCIGAELIFMGDRLSLIATQDGRVHSLYGGWKALADVMLKYRLLKLYCGESDDLGEAIKQLFHPDAIQCVVRELGWITKESIHNYRWNMNKNKTTLHLRKGNDHAWIEDVSGYVLPLDSNSSLAEIGGICTELQGCLLMENLSSSSLATGSAAALAVQRFGGGGQLGKRQKEILAPMLAVAMGSIKGHTEQLVNPNITMGYTYDKKSAHPTYYRNMPNLADAEWYPTKEIKVLLEAPIGFTKVRFINPGHKEGIIKMRVEHRGEVGLFFPALDEGIVSVATPELRLMKEMGYGLEVVASNRQESFAIFPSDSSKPNAEVVDKLEGCLIRYPKFKSYFKTVKAALGGIHASSRRRCNPPTLKVYEYIPNYHPAPEFSDELEAYTSMTDFITLAHLYSMEHYELMKGHLEAGDEAIQDTGDCITSSKRLKLPLELGYKEQYGLIVPISDSRGNRPGGPDTYDFEKILKNTPPEQTYLVLGERSRRAGLEPFMNLQYIDNLTPEFVKDVCSGRYTVEERLQLGSSVRIGPIPTAQQMGEGSAEKTKSPRTPGEIYQKLDERRKRRGTQWKNCQR